MMSPEDKEEINVLVFVTIDGINIVFFSGASKEKFVASFITKFMMSVEEFSRVSGFAKIDGSVFKVWNAGIIS